jgi:hypothetical protein
LISTRWIGALALVEIGEPERWQRRVALAIAIALNICFLIALNRLMFVRPTLSETPAAYMEARLIDTTPPPEPTPPQISILSSAASVHVRSQALTNATPPIAPTVAAPPKLDLFTPDGQVRLPTEAVSSPNASKGFPTTPIKPTDRNPFAHVDLLPYIRGRLENAWAAPANESLGAKAMRKFYSHRWTMPWGAPISCEQGTPTTETPIVIDCRSGASSASSEELRAMRADPPAPKTPPVAGFPR